MNKLRNAEIEGGGAMPIFSVVKAPVIALIAKRGYDSIGQLGWLGGTTRLGGETTRRETRKQTLCWWNSSTHVAL